MNLSFSSLSLMRNCPGAWVARYIEKEKVPPGEAAKIGSDITRVIAETWKCKIDPKSPAAQETNVEITPDAYDLASFYTAQPDAVQWKNAEIAEKQIKIKPEELVAAADFYGVQLPSKVFPLVGYIDFFKNDPGPMILEIKTRGRKGFSADWSWQNSLYALAEHAQSVEVHIITRTKVPKLYVYKIDLKPELFQWSLRMTFHYMDKIHHALNGSLISTENPGYWCSWCPKSIDCLAYMESIRVEE